MLERLIKDRRSDQTNYHCYECQKAQKRIDALHSFVG
jgi:hypothetical protein